MTCCRGSTRGSLWRDCQLLLCLLSTPTKTLADTPCLSTGEGGREEGAVVNSVPLPDGLDLTLTCRFSLVYSSLSHCSMGQVPHRHTGSHTECGCTGRRPGTLSLQPLLPCGTPERGRGRGADNLPPSQFWLSLCLVGLPGQSPSLPSAADWGPPSHCRPPPGEYSGCLGRKRGSNIQQN